MLNLTTNTPLNQIGSSGYGVDAFGRYGAGNASQARTVDNSPDYAILVGGKYVSRKTGQPFHGTDPNTGWNFNNGVQVQNDPGKVTIPGTNTQINPNDLSQRLSTFSMEKNPAEAAQQRDLLAKFTKTANDTITNFTDHLPKFSANLDTAQKLGTQANDIQPLVTGLTKAQADYGTNLDASNQRYQQALDTNQAAQRGVIQKQYDTLPAFDTATNNLINWQENQVGRNFSRYKAGTNTPTSGGSDEVRILAEQARAAALPLEMSKINQRYDIMGRDLGVEQGIGAQDINYAGSYMPSIAGSRYSSQSNVQLAIQQAKQAAAQGAYTQAFQYLQSAGIPPEKMQQLLTTDIGQLGALNNLRNETNYTMMQDKLGVNLTQPYSPNLSTPPLPNYPPRYPQSRGYNPNPVNLGAGAPREVNPTTTGTDAYQGQPSPSENPNQWQDVGTGVMNMYTGQIVPYGQSGGGAQNNFGSNNYGSQSGTTYNPSSYDPNSGSMVDRYSGQVSQLPWLGTPDFSIDPSMYNYQG